MATETAAYAQLKELAERYIASLSNVEGELGYGSERGIASATLKEFFEFVEGNELERLKKELESANETIGQLGDEVTRLMRESNNYKDERDELKAKLEKFEQL